MNKKKLKRREEKEKNNKRKDPNLYKNILYIFGGRMRSSEAAMGRGGRAAPRLGWQ
jgi:hypothetical protein